MKECPHPNFVILVNGDKEITCCRICGERIEDWLLYRVWTLLWFQHDRSNNNVWMWMPWMIEILKT